MVAKLDQLGAPVTLAIGLDSVFRTKLSEDMFKGLAPWLERLPGRLLHTNVVGCTIFAAISGSSAATCATIGSAYYLRKVHGWDMLSAMLGSTPGALSQVIAHATQYHSDLRGIAFVQTVRVVILSGGRSSEHDVSLDSGRSVTEGLEAAGHEPVPVLTAPDSTVFVQSRGTEKNRYH
mgnify:CR=1 FL=1